MTQRDTDQPSFDPKHRIIGAIVVVVLAVILLPIVLSDRPPSPEPNSANTAPPSEPATGDNKVAVTVVSRPPAAAEPANIPAASPPPPLNTPAPVPAPAPASKPTPAKPAPEAKAAPKSAAPTETKPVASGWVVQVGTFSNAANAAKLEQKLRAHGDSVRAEQINLEGGKAVRLRVGPFPDRNAALKAQDRIQKDIGVKGVVLAYP